MSNKSSTSTTPSTASKFSILFYLSLLILGLLQAWGTELFDDEAYYWIYSLYPDWGYFDHPPMIGWLIKAGTWLFKGELGVRFFIVLMGVATIWIIELLTRPSDRKLFYLMVLNMAILQIGGILAVPDIPLLFFTVLFFLCYRYYTEQPTYQSAILLACIIALMLYSKYHGILVILFTLISNLKLLKKPATWLVILLSVLLYMPHINWQSDHGFPSIQYQLFERVSPPYRFSFTTDYILGQLLISGPFIGWLLIWMSFRYKPQDSTQRAMKWSMAGIYLVFLVSSFRSRTEANWTIPLLAPILVLSYHGLKQHPHLIKWVYRLAPLSLLLIISLRVFMWVDIPVSKFIPKDEFHQNKTWAESIRKKAAGRPVVFTNSYQRASKYWFYSGDTSFSLNTPSYRRSQFNHWPVEKRFFKREVMIAGSMESGPWQDSVPTPKKQMGIRFDSSFRSYSRISLYSTDVISSNPSGLLEAVLTIDAVSQSALDTALRYRPEVMLIIYKGDKMKPQLVHTGKKLFPQFGNQLIIRTQLPPLEDKQYTIRWGIASSFREPTINSKVYTLVNGTYR